MTVYARGSEFQIVIIEETVWGTTPGTPSGYKMPVISVSEGWYTQNTLPNPELRSNRNPSAPVDGDIIVKGSITMGMHLDAVGWLIKHGIGVPVTTGSGPYEHVSKLGYDGASVGDLPAGLTIEHGYTSKDKYIPYEGCKISTLGFKAAGSEGIATVEVGIIGKTEAAISGTALDASPTEYTSTALANYHATIKEGGTTLGSAAEVTFDLDNGLDDKTRTIGSAGQITDLPESAAVVSGTLVAFFADEALYNKAKAGTESSLELTWTQGANSLVLDVEELRYTPKSPAVSGPAGVKVTLAFTGYYQDGASASAITSTLTNDVVSY